jgi:hypothetical protein
MLGAAACTVFTFFAAAPSLAQDAEETRTEFDESAVPDSGKSVKDFVPAGWKIEEDVKGDLNQDGVIDHALKLIENKTVKEDEVSDLSRALVIVFGGKGGLKKAAVAGKILQCTGCGGAFYGAMPAPANVSIAKGVLTVMNDHGSRWVTEVKYKFRYDEQPGMFILIGFDYVSRDRAEGSVTTESTNYLTGKRITTTGKGKKTTTKNSAVAKEKFEIGSVDTDEWESQATTRLGLD